jgi:hypothetical protein
MVEARNKAVTILADPTQSDEIKEDIKIYLLKVQKEIDTLT